MTRHRMLAALAALALALTGCSVSAEPDEAGLAYDAGSLSDTTFQECVPHGGRTWVGPEDQGFVYPYGERSYVFDPGAESADSDAFAVLSSDDLEMTVTGVLSFSLNTDCDTLKQFHERIGIKYGASSEGVGQWGELLDVYLGQPLRRVMTDAAEEFTATQLYSDPAMRSAWEARVRDDLPGAVEALAKGPYFQDFTLTVQKPQPPQALLDQLREQQVQQERINTIEAQRLAQEAEIAQIEALVRILGPNGYILFRNQVQCEENAESCVPFVPVPQGSDLNVGAGGN